MNSESRFAKTMTVVLAVVMIAAVTGCATQGSGGTKLAYKEMATEMNKFTNVIKVCEQAGAVMHCSFEDRDRVREEHERLVEALRYYDY